MSRRRLTSAPGRTPAGVVLVMAALAASAFGQDATEVARDLLAGRRSAAEAVRAWEAAGVSPASARELVASARLDAGPPEDHEATLSDQLGRESRLEVVVPPKPRADGRYGVLVVLHGLRGHAGQLVPFARKVAPPGTIVVAPSARPLPIEHENEDSWVVRAPGEEEPEGPRDPRWWVERAHGALLPHWWSYRPDGFPLLALRHVLARYPVDTDRVAILGYSMGGFGTWNVGVRYADRFAAMVPLAGGISRKETALPRDERSRHLLGNARMTRTFVAHGDRDPVVPVRFSRTLVEELAALEAPHVYEEVPEGGHVLRSFLRGDERTERLASWLAAQVRDPHPPRVDLHAIGPYHAASFWLRLDALDGSRASARAEVKGASRVVVTCSGVSRLTVFLDPALVDVDARLRLEVNGQLLHDGPVAPSLAAVAESFARLGDPALTYERAVTVDVPVERSF